MKRSGQILVRQHELSTFVECRKKFDLSFNKKIIPRRTKRALNIGGLFATGVYHLHKGRDIATSMAIIDKTASDLIKSAVSQDHVNEIETDKVIVIAMLEGYKERFMQQKLDITPECRISVPISKKFRYVMTLDGRIKTYKKDQWLLEIKTSAQIQKDQIIRLPIDFQLRSYVWGLEKWSHKPVSGILYRFIRKPSIAQRKNESAIQFQKRLGLDYLERQDFYFYDEMPLLDRNALAGFETELKEIFADLEHCYKTNHWYHSPLCGKTKFGDCQYFHYCTNPTQETLDTFYEKQT